MSPAHARGSYSGEILQIAVAGIDGIDVTFKRLIRLVPGRHNHASARLANGFKTISRGRSGSSSRIL